MPNYIGHSVINTLIGTASGIYLYSADIYTLNQVAMSASVFMFATLFLSPDLDLNYSRPTKNWGPLKFVWRPYSWLSKHRGLSHNVFMGTFCRILYITIVATVLFVFFHIVFEQHNEPNISLFLTALSKIQNMIFSMPMDGSSNLFLIIGSIFYSDLCHVLADKIL